MRSISVFDLFSIGIGPSSSHTVGPMKAAYDFVTKLELSQLLNQVKQLQIDLYGSLALTGKGHGTDHAILMGLEGNLPHSVIPEQVLPRAQAINQTQQLMLAGHYLLPFIPSQHLAFHQHELLPLHTNGLRFTALSAKQEVLLTQVYYSVGGGFIVTEEEFGLAKIDKSLPYPFKTASELFHHCRQQHLAISDIMLANEKAWRTEKEIKQGLLEIFSIMRLCIEKGCHTEGYLPGGLQVKRRAPELYRKLQAQLSTKPELATASSMLWPTVYAMAVNEENAAGGRIVTAPTNGSAGIIPAVLNFYTNFHTDANDEGIITFLLTAGAIGILYKAGASISGAEVGCQGEVGVACSMAAGAYTAVMGGTIEQIENAAEMAMEHHLGLTCDPIAGLVQIPCIERNGIAAEKAIKLAHLALLEDGKSKKVSLDKIIATMMQTGRDMQTIYKETSLGGLAANVPEC